MRENWKLRKGFCYFKIQKESCTASIDKQFFGIVICIFVWPVTNDTMWFIFIFLEYVHKPVPVSYVCKCNGRAMTFDPVFSC
jgi:hypothetical protein